MLADIQMDLLSVIQTAFEKHYPERAYYRDRIALELAESWARARPQVAEGLSLTFGSREADAEKLAALDILWDQVAEIVSEVEFTFPGQPENAKTEQQWRHQPVKHLDGPKDKDDSLSLEGLSRAASVYLRAKWAESPGLECWLARQMIYAECFAFSREAGVPMRLKSMSFWWTFGKESTKWLIGVFVAFSVGEAYGAGVGLLSYLAWVCMLHVLSSSRAKLKLTVLNTFLAMRSAYQVSLRAGAYPIEIERHLGLAENVGAIWPEGLRPLLHRAIARNPLQWSSLC